jgi:hypothetical protein
VARDKIDSLEDSVKRSDKIGAALILGLTFAWAVVSTQWLLESYRKQSIQRFIEAAIEATSKAPVPAQFPLSMVPGNPIAACTIIGYEHLDEVEAFVGPDLMSRTDLGGGHMGSILFVFPSHTVTIKPPTFFRVKGTSCFGKQGLVFVTIEGPDIGFRMFTLLGSSRD